MNKTPKKLLGHILVIDDDEAARLSISQMLKLRGYKAEAFSSAKEALAWPELGADNRAHCDREFDHVAQAVRLAAIYDAVTE